MALTKAMNIYWFRLAFAALFSTRVNCLVWSLQAFVTRIISYQQSKFNLGKNLRISCDQIKKLKFSIDRTFNLESPHSVSNFSRWSRCQRTAECWRGFAPILLRMVRAVGRNGLASRSAASWPCLWSFAWSRVHFTVWNSCESIWRSRYRRFFKSARHFVASTCTWLSCLRGNESSAYLIACRISTERRVSFFIFCIRTNQPVYFKFAVDVLLWKNSLVFVFHQIPRNRLAFWWKQTKSANGSGRFILNSSKCILSQWAFPYWRPRSTFG